MLSTGQSNSVGNEAFPPLTMTQPYRNIMFNVGIIPGTNCDGNGCRVYEKPTSFIPLTEGDYFFDYAVETMSAGMANLVGKLGAEKLLVGKPSHDLLVSLHGRSGYTYACLRKNGCDFFGTPNPYTTPFDDGMNEVSDAMDLAKAAGKTYVVRAVTAIHGESDHYAYTMGLAEFPMPGTDGTSTIQNYADAMLEWQRDYDRGVKTITGQTDDVPLLQLQMSNWNDVPHSQIPTWQLEAHTRAPGKVVLVGPSYIFEYAGDCLHYSNHGERHIGEYFAKVYARMFIEGLPWEPVRPKQVTLDGTVVTAKFYVPKPPLVLDANRVSNPGNYGFEFYDTSGSPPKITAVEVVGDDTVKVTLDRKPSNGARLRYAYTAVPLTCPGVESGPRGNLRDSDDTPSNNSYELFNWAVVFDEPVN
ncbi:Endo-1,4-beta-xylanase Z precursor [Labilithrix luteola]|uniref:Endo-1,4-beta-xylanase Z n=1 Tax=Labilithrix luteola TaxID=1391654 RepID=A0A0K1Q9B2_9BACT|nr:Endo-1,4-beta-xylanase Z precursor [Labilithrix luteola]